MQISLDKLSNIERRLTISVPFEQITNEVQDRLKQMAPKVKMKGFRVGKVPLSVVKKQFEETVLKEVTLDTLKKTLAEALEKEKLNPLGAPKIDVTNANPKENFTYTATFEIYPEIALTDLGKINAEKIVASVTEQDVDEKLAMMLKQRATWKKIADAVHVIQAGDTVVVDFDLTTKQDDKTKTETEKNVKFEIGSGEMWQDFEKPLLGHKVGEEIKFSLTFPATHLQSEMAGKEAEFTVRIIDLLERELPETDEAFCQSVNPKIKNIDELRAFIKQQMEHELQAKILNKFKQTISDKLLELHTIDIPKTFVEDEINRRQEKARQYMKQYTKEKLPDLPRDKLEEPAKKTIATEMIFLKIAEVNSIKVSPDKLKAKIEAIAASYQKPAEIINWYYSDKRHLASVESELLEEEILNYLMQAVQLSDKQLSYKEAIQ